LENQFWQCWRKADQNYYKLLITNTSHEVVGTSFNVMLRHLTNCVVVGGDIVRLLSHLK